MLILALSLLILGAILSVAGYSKKLDEQKEKKSFIVLVTTPFLIYLFPGATLMVIGVILLALLAGGVHF